MPALTPALHMSGSLLRQPGNVVRVTQPGMRYCLQLDRAVAEPGLPLGAQIQDPAPLLTRKIEIGQCTEGPDVHLTLAGFAGALSKEDIANLAAWFSSRPPALSSKY